MLQRSQTLWLLLATASALLSFMFPFATGKAMEKNVLTDKAIEADSNFFLLVLTGASLLLSAGIIFLYKNRKQQMRLCLLGILISLLILVVYFLQFQKLTSATLALYCILPFAILAGYVMAFRGIRKDEKLVKSLDKLR
jgi:peptidoglycan/LPS O-acetylase OafA/YrhL